jgi:hypothetical protein
MLDCVKILLLSLSGASIEFTMAKDAVLVGPSRQMKSFPFTFEHHPGGSRRLIQERGTMAAYWAINGTGRQTQYALAHRSWLGQACSVDTHNK